MEDRCTACGSTDLEFRATPIPEPAPVPGGPTRRWNYWGRCKQCGISLCKEAPPRGVTTGTVVATATHPVQ